MNRRTMFSNGRYIVRIESLPATLERQQRNILLDRVSIEIGSNEAPDADNVVTILSLRGTTVPAIYADVDCRGTCRRQNH